MGEDSSFYDVKLLCNKYLVYQRGSLTASTLEAIPAIGPPDFLEADYQQRVALIFSSRITRRVVVVVVVVVVFSCFFL